MEPHRSSIHHLSLLHTSTTPHICFAQRQRFPRKVNRANCLINRVLWLRTSGRVFAIGVWKKKDRKGVASGGIWTRAGRLVGEKEGWVVSSNKFIFVGLLFCCCGALLFCLFEMRRRTLGNSKWNAFPEVKGWEEVEKNEFLHKVWCGFAARVCRCRYASWSRACVDILSWVGDVEDPK